jgi:hypothetical protein
MTLVLYDSVTLSQIPPNPPAVGGYVGGNFPTFSRLAADFPRAKLLSIAVNAGEDAECLDIETGDAVPAQAPAWYARQKARGVTRPCLYANTSTMPSVVAALSGAYIARGDYRVWPADFTFAAHIEPGSDATQWTDVALGRNLDQSQCVDNFFGDPPAPKPIVNPTHYDWFATGPFPSEWGNLDERSVVEHYDGARQHWITYKLFLSKLRAQCQFLADRVAYVAIHKPVNGKPSWGVDYRGWRFQQLSARAQGMRFV